MECDYIILQTKSAKIRVPRNVVKQQLDVAFRYINLTLNNDCVWTATEVGVKQLCDLYQHSTFKPWHDEYYCQRVPEKYGTDNYFRWDETAYQHKDIITSWAYNYELIKADRADLHTELIHKLLNYTI